MDSTEAWIELSFGSRHQLSYLRHVDAQALDVPSRLQQVGFELVVKCLLLNMIGGKQPICQLKVEQGVDFPLSSHQARVEREQNGRCYQETIEGLLVLHTTREAEGIMAVIVKPEQGVTHYGLVTV